MSNVAKSAIFLMITTLASKVLGFGRELVLASSYGTSAYSDAYIVALNIPLVIFSSIGLALSTTFIPLYYNVRECEGEIESNRFTNNVFNIVIILCIVIAILGLIFTKPLLKLFAMGFEGETLDIALKFTKVLIIGVVFTGLTYLMTSYLHANNSFTIPGIIGIPKNIIIIISIILSLEFNPYILVYGTLIAMASEFIIQIPFACKKGYKYERYINLKDERLKEMIWLIGPVFIGTAVNQINTMVDRTLASTLVEGSIASLNYANKLNSFIMGIFIASISSIIYPMLAKLSVENNTRKFNDSIVKSVNIIILLIIPISMGAIVLSNPIVKILFQRGAFDSKATNMTAIALVFYSIGLIGFGLRDILGKVFYAIQDTKTPMINGAISMILNIVLNLLLIKPMGHVGLAFATSISAIVCILLLFYSLSKKIGYFGQDKIIKNTLKSIVASIVMGIITYYGHKLLCSTLESGLIYEIIALLGSIILGVIVYGLLIVLLKVEEVRVITDMLRRKRRVESLSN